MIILSTSPGVMRKFFAKEIAPDWPYFYCSNDFSITRMDFGIFPVEDLKLEPDIHNPAAFKQSYQNIVEAYNSNNGNLILGGTFSKCFLNKVKTDFRNVEILHILRHPSVSYAVYNPSKDESPLGLDRVIPFTIASICDNITLSKLDYVTTVRFEDVLLNNQFEFCGKVYRCPKVHTNYNNLITRYEYVMNKRNPINYTLLDLFNQRFTSLNTSFVNGHNDPRLPNNVFLDLGYEPITYQQIFDEIL